MLAGALQLPPVAFWRAPARAGAQCHSWASSKSNPVVAPKSSLGSSHSSHGNERHFSTGLPVGTSAPQSLWSQPSKECLIPILFVSCNQDKCKEPEEIYSCLQDCPKLFEAFLSPGDTMLNTTEGTYELHR